MAIDRLDNGFIKHLQCQSVARNRRSPSLKIAGMMLSVGHAMLQKSRWIQRQLKLWKQLTWMSCCLRPWPAAGNHRLSKDVGQDPMQKLEHCDAWFPKNLHMKRDQLPTPCKLCWWENAVVAFFLARRNYGRPWYDLGLPPFDLPFGNWT